MVVTVKARARAESVSLKINKGKAKPVNELPNVEIVCPVQNFQKSLLVHVLAAEEQADIKFLPISKRKECCLFLRVTCYLHSPQGKFYAFSIGHV